MKRCLCALFLLTVAFQLVMPAIAQAALKGITGSFELYYARQPAGSTEPSFSVTIPGIFAAAEDDFVAEATYPLPGGGDEKVRLLLLENAQKLLLMYPETMNYRKVITVGRMKELMETIPQMVGTYFEATPESLQKRGIKLVSQGRTIVNGERLLAYSLPLPNEDEPSLKGKTGVEWRLTLYFTPTAKRLRFLQVKAAESLLRLKLLNVKKAEVKPDRFKVPSGYYETEPLNISSGGHG